MAQSRAALEVQQVWKEAHGPGAPANLVTSSAIDSKHAGLRRVTDRES